MEFQKNFPTLKLREVFLGDEGCAALAAFLESHDTFAELDLHGNNVTGVGIRYLTRYLVRTTALKELSLEWNSVGLSAQGMEELCAALAENTSIASVNLQNNKISEVSSAPLANLIRSTKTLQKLDLRWNEIGNDGIQALIPALERNQSLVELEIAGNKANLEVVNIIGTFSYLH